MQTANDSIAGQIAKTFIARKDVKAVQNRSGAYMPVTTDMKPESDRLPWTMGDLRAHVSGEKTYGHYVVSKENTAKVFCFDLDLEKQLLWDEKREPRWAAMVPGRDEPLERQGDARSLWHPERLWQWCGNCSKGWYPDFQPARCANEDHVHMLSEGANPDTIALTAILQQTAFSLADRIRTLLDIPTAVAYSGNKGIHVYGLVGEAPAADVRMGATLVLDSFEGKYVPARGTNFYRNIDPDFEAVSVEVFPKQEGLDGKDLGNLLRLPMGVNRKSGNRAYFLRYGSYGELTEHTDPLKAMTGDMDPWAEAAS